MIDAYCPLPKAQLVCSVILRIFYVRAAAMSAVVDISGASLAEVDAFPLLCVSSSTVPPFSTLRQGDATLRVVPIIVGDNGMHVGTEIGLRPL